LNYAELSAKAALTPSRVKATVDLSAVVLAYGVPLTPIASGEKLIGNCPFHDDTVPSFTVWLTEHGEWACGCWACDFGPGDLFTFLMAWHDCSFSEALNKATEIDPEDLPEPPPIRPESIIRATVSLDDVYARGTERAAVQDLLDARGVTVPARWVIDEFRVRADGGTVLIPHFDSSGEKLIGIKRRAEYIQGWKSIAARGSELSSLYGTFRWHGCKFNEVIVCEGESDTWTVSYLWRGDSSTAVVGLPCGVGATPREEWLSFLKHKDVVLLFDADRAGYDGALRWCTALDGVSTGTWVAVLPAGEDATSAGSDWVYEMVEEAASESEYRSKYASGWYK
jgi:hypothetical protein